MEKNMEDLKNFILKTEEVINFWEKDKEKIEKNLEKIHQESNIARTVGTSVSTAGAGLFVGALLLAPLTGGISIIAASGLGAACGIGGAAVSYTHLDVYKRQAYCLSNQSSSLDVFSIAAN